MSGSVFQVQPGAAQQITGAALTHGATVWNRDEANSLWVSSDRYCAPNLGLELPPQASCNWTGKQLFASVDTGVTTPIDLQISNDVQNVSDPVGIAEAIALIGIPSVFLTDTLFNNVLAPGASSVLNVSEYASLLLRMSNRVAGQQISLQILWYADTAGTVFTGIGDNLTLGNHPLVIQADAWELPVRGKSVRFLVQSFSGGSANFFIQGTNRLVPTIKQIITTQLPRFLTTGLIDQVAGTAYNFVNADGLGDYTSLNGEINATLNTNGSLASTGFVDSLVTAYNATEQGTIVNTQTPVNGFTALYKHPNIPVRWVWIAETTTNAVQMNLSLFPTGQQ